MLKINKIFLYDEPSVPEIEFENLAKFIKETFNVQVELRKHFFEHFRSDKKIASDLASIRVFNPYTSFEKHDPTSEEVIFEEESFTNKFASNNIILYDGFEFQNLLKEIIPQEELTLDHFHLIFTTRLTCTCDDEGYKYHGRAVICSNPAIISTTGIIEAPAKPREFYLRMHPAISQGLNQEVLKEQFRGRFLEYHDKKLSTVVKGYAMQTIFYYLTTDAFCGSKDCILYNAHWQEDLIHSQIEIGKLCNTHQKILDSIKNTS